MTCLICKAAEPVQGTTTVTLERGELTLVIKEVPALVCPNCGEDYVDEDTFQSCMSCHEEGGKDPKNCKGCHK